MTGSVGAASRTMILIGLTLLISACLGSGGDGDAPVNGGSSGATNGESAGPEAPPDVETSLERLGVSTEETPRLDSQGNAYPDDYAPMGRIITVRELRQAQDAPTDSEPRFAVGRAEELFLGGFRLDDGGDRHVNIIDDISLAGLSASAAAFTDPQVIESRAHTPWMHDSRTIVDAPPSNVPWGTLRDTAAVDTNGDGFLEAVTAYVQEGSGGAQQLRLQIMDGLDSTPILDFAILEGGPLLPAHDVRVSGVDLDGDGRQEIAVAIAREPQDGVFDTAVGVYIIDDALSDFGVIDQYLFDYEPSFAQPYVLLEIAEFRADHGNSGNTLAFVLNESEPFAPGSGNFASRFFIMELADGALTELAGGPITAEVFVEETPEEPREARAVVASITTGDINGDGSEELVFGALEAVVASCAATSADLDPHAEYFLAAYGGRHNGFAPIAATSTKVAVPHCNFESGDRPFTMRHVQINVLDFNNDNHANVQFNEFVLNGVPERLWHTGVIAHIDDPRLIYGFRSTGHLYFDRSESAIAVSDQTGDGVQNIIGLFANVADSTDSVHFSVYEWDPDSDNGYRVATRIAIESEDWGNRNPLIVPMDVNNDRIAQYRYTGEYYYDITEPIVLAAIAAPPCRRNVGQDACFSSWGSAISSNIGREFSVKVFGSVGFGVGAAGLGAHVESMVTLSASAALVTSESYELAKSQTFSTGPWEDGVVFTSVPMDRYYYELIRDNTGEIGSIGDRIEFRLPRDPGLRIVDRVYYNDNVVEGTVLIEENVFRHTPGNISSYPDATEKSSILDAQQDLVRQRRVELVRLDAFDFAPAVRGAEVGPVYVGQGGGFTELALEYTETVGQANALTASASFDIKTIAGAAASFSVGVEAGRTMSVSHGDRALFSGSVDSIHADYYAENRYAFGLFVYLQTLDDREMEVINFWVEE